MRLDKPALFAHLGYEPHPGQLEVHLSSVARRVVACGVRWGKTKCAAMETVAALMTPAKASLGWVVAPTFDLTDLVLGTVQNVIEDRLSHRIVEIDRRARRIVIRNLAGNLVVVEGRSCERRTNLLGAGLDWLIVDEAAAVRGDIWDEFLSQRLIDKEGWALVTSTPRGDMSWFFDLFERGQGDDPDFQSWSRPSWENPRLDRAVIEKERERLTPEVFAQEYGGEFLAGHGIVCRACGGPDPLGVDVVLLQGDEKLRHCDRCGKHVDAEGRSIGALGRDGLVHLKVIVLEDEGEDEDEDDVDVTTESLGVGSG